MADESGAQTEAPVRDGRTLRKERSRESVVDAILDLLAEGVPQPTAQQIADRSGVSLRSIFRIFDDVEALHAAAIDAQAARVGALLVALPHDGPVEDRIRVLVDNRVAVFEQIAPVRRLALRLAPQSAVIAGELERSTAAFRDQVAAVFGPELDGCPSGERRDLLDALDLACGFEAWAAMRHGRSYPVARARRVLVTTLEHLTRR